VTSIWCAMDKVLSLARLMSSPDLYPVGVDVDNRAIYFTKISRSRYKELSWLDPGAPQLNQVVHSVNLDDLLLYSRCEHRPSAPIHYVLHGAFCCSTLLSRYFDLIKTCFVLREPSIIAHVSVMKFKNAMSSRTGFNDAEEAEWCELIGLSLRLLSRTHTPNETVIIKMNDLCNAIGDILLRWDSRSKVVFLSIDLRTFILSCLKSERRRSWVRMRVKDTAGIAASLPNWKGLDLASLTDAEAAAYLWLLNLTLRRGLCLGPDSARVMVIDGAQVAENGPEVVQSLTRFFGLSISDADLVRIRTDRIASRYSKDLSRDYDSKSRRDEIMELERSLGGEIEGGVEWVWRNNPLMAQLGTVSA
jgi:hypothetical protein